MTPIIIQTNEEGKKAVQSLCDIALKTGGLQNLAGINQIIVSIKPLPVKETEIETPAEA